MYNRVGRYVTDETVLKMKGIDKGIDNFELYKVFLTKTMLIPYTVKIQSILFGEPVNVQVICIEGPKFFKRSENRSNTEDIQVIEDQVRD